MELKGLITELPAVCRVQIKERNYGIKFDGGISTLLRPENKNTKKLDMYMGDLGAYSWPTRDPNGQHE